MRKRSMRAFFLSALIVILSTLGLSTGVEAALENPLDQREDSPAVPSALYHALLAHFQAITPEESTTGVYQTQNPVQEISIRFRTDGIEIKPHQEKKNWRWGLTLTAFGYGESLRPVDAPRMQTEGNRISYMRGNVSEWYINDAGGLEQGFTIIAPPASPKEAQSKPLVLAMTLSGDLKPKWRTEGEAVVFTDAEGDIVLRYEKLYAFDAAGRSLPARLCLEDGTVSIEVDDTGAAYPITIDPVIFTQEAKLLSSDGAGSQSFGLSVSIDGDTALVGGRFIAPSGNLAGAAYVFVRSGTAWTQQAKLVPSGGATIVSFGISVSINADTALIGAFNEGGSGSAYVFVRSGTAWTQQAKLLPSDGGSLDDLFGVSVSISGDTALIGTIFDDDQGTDSGSAYVFVRSGTTWTQQAKILPADGASGDSFGGSVSIDDDSALIGASGDDDNGTNSGSAYVFVRSGTTWTQQAKIVPADGGANKAFGVVVSLDGDSALIGAAQDHPLINNAGAAYVFIRSGAAWSEQAKLVQPGTPGSDAFGRSASISGDLALIGASQADRQGSDSGSVYVFQRSGTAWSLAGEIIPADGSGSDNFGFRVSISGNTALVGALGDDDNVPESGSAYIFRIGGNEPPTADAGPDQSVNEGSLVTLDGSGSVDPGGNPLTYHWTQVAGSNVTLNLSDPVHPTFTAPSVSVGGETLTFQLIVDNGTLSSDPDTVDITVKNVNNAPVADAGDDQTVQEGSPVALDGSDSFDPDNEPLTYHWVQTAGTGVTLSDPTAVQPSFTAPMVGSSGETLTFELTVGDGIDTATDAVNVFVENVNHPPTADAGPDQTVHEGSQVVLNGTGSGDPDNDPLTYSWNQLSGTPVTLSSSHSSTPTFTAPQVAPGGETLVFGLTVSDGELASPPDTVSIHILNVNDPPACGLAQASASGLWPPNHKLLPVEILNVTDPNNDQIILTITGVTQDEPVSGLGDGDTSPDAVLQGDTVLIRAERSGGENGRVYRIQFTADDGQGGTCAGAVSVSVPHSKKGTAVDDGQIYNATLP